MMNEVLASLACGRPIWRGTLKYCQAADPRDPKMLAMHEAAERYLDWPARFKVGGGEGRGGEGVCG